jgi:uncharacterized protein YcnI
VVAVTALLLALLVAAPAAAHVEVEPTEAIAGSTVTVTFSFHHGLDGADTTALEVRMPPGTEVLEVPAKEGWLIDVSDTDPQVVTWSGGRVPDGVMETFPARVRLPAEPGDVLFPAIQTTDAGELAWIAQEGGPGEADRPAPRMTLLPDPAAPPPDRAPDPAADAAPPLEDPAPDAAPLRELEADRWSVPGWLVVVGLLGLGALGVAVGVWLRRRRVGP